MESMYYNYMIDSEQLYYVAYLYKQFCGVVSDAGMKESNLLLKGVLLNRDVLNQPLKSQVGWLG